jgi:uncharacterized DUF497 family protein
VRYEWDSRKARSNAVRHKVTFDEARTVFDDYFSVSGPDPDHSIDEERFVTFGRSVHNRLLVVAHTDRAGTIRIISARPATARERWLYEEG